MTPAIRFLRDNGVDFEPHLYSYVEKGGTRASSQALGVPEHHVVKTLVMETDARKPLIVLQHGDLEVSTKELARALGVKKIASCSPETAEKHTGYQVGGTSPFGTRSKLPVYVEASILGLDWILINGGKRGFLVRIQPGELRRVLQIQEVSAAIPR